MLVAQPSSRPGGHDVATWRGRPAVATVIRVAVAGVPFLAAVVSSFLIARTFPQPDDGLGAVLWWIGVAMASTAVLVVVDRVARRALPLAVLYQCTLVFPDQAPSRFGVALRAASPRALQARVAEVSEHGLPTERAVAAAQVLELAAALNHHDRMTRGHCERVRAYTELIAEELGLPEAQRERLRWAALLHDVGKLLVPSEVLNKPGRPDADEWEVLKRHPLYGEELVAPLLDWLGESAAAIGQHHERADGTGYPRALPADEQNLAARIVQVADAFDVMTSARSYKRPMPAASARAELVRCAGTQFDPVVVRAFLNVSIGRVRLVMGPLAALAHLPVVGPAAAAPSLPAAAASLGSVGATGAVAIAASTIGVLPARAVAASPAPSTVPATVEADPAAAVVPDGGVAMSSTGVEVTAPLRAPEPVGAMPDPAATGPDTTAPATTAPATTAPATTAPATTAPATTAPAATAPATTTVTAAAAPPVPVQQAGVVAPIASTPAASTPAMSTPAATAPAAPREPSPPPKSTTVPGPATTKPADLERHDDRHDHDRDDDDCDVDDRIEELEELLPGGRNVVLDELNVLLRTCVQALLDEANALEAQARSAGREEARRLREEAADLREDAAENREEIEEFRRRVERMP